LSTFFSDHHMGVDMDMDMDIDMEMVFRSGFRERETESRGSRGGAGRGAQEGEYINRAVWAQGTHEIERTEKGQGRPPGGAEDMHVVTTFARLTLRALPPTTHRTPQVHA
jgi:hypothetical protein